MSHHLQNASIENWGNIQIATYEEIKLFTIKTHIITSRTLYIPPKNLGSLQYTTDTIDSERIETHLRMSPVIILGAAALIALIFL